MSISSFAILVPAQIKPGDFFQIIVRALDASGNVLTSDSTTTVELTSADLELLYDANEDSNFTLSDNQKTLTNGEAIFDVFDSQEGSFTLNADNSPDGPITVTGTTEVPYVFNAVPVKQLTSNPLETATLENPRFLFSPDTVALDAVDDPVPQEETSNTVELRDALPVTLVP